MASWIKSLFGSSTPSTDSKDEHLLSPSETPKNRAWIGVDLDGTLAEYGRWSGVGHIGKPVPLMKQRVLEWIEKGYTIKILTARASIPDHVPAVHKWLAKHGFPPLEVTNQKDYSMIELWDDRAIQVVANTGRAVILPTMKARPKAPLFSEEQATETFETALMREAPPEKEIEK